LLTWNQLFMGLLSFLKRTPGNTPNSAAPAKSKAKAPPVAESPDSVAQARTRARQRLIGAAVLVIAGVIGFPLLFETQPRPLPVDTPVELRRDTPAAAPATTPAPAATTARAADAKPAPLPPSVINENTADAGREPPASAPAAVVPPPAVAAVTPKPAPVPAPAPGERKPAEKPADKPADKPAAKPADSARAQALLDGKPATPEAAGRFVVQVGAFAEVTAARDARHKVEKLGLKTYTQVVETSAGNRIRVRVGPFASRDEADRAAAKIKTAGLPSAILTL
jgi:DedD protein